MMVHDDLVESLIKRRQLFYVIKIELQKPTSVGECGCTRHIHFKFIKLQSYGSLRLQLIHGYLESISHLHVRYVMDILISPPQHTTMGKKILEV